MHYRETTFGFEYGAAEVCRLWADERQGRVCIGLASTRYYTPNNIVIYVTRTGKVRIFSGGQEWKPPARRLSRHGRHGRPPGIVTRKENRQ